MWFFLGMLAGAALVVVLAVIFFIWISSEFTIIDP